MHLKWPPGLEIQAPRGLSGASESHACNAANDSEVGTQARTLNPLEAFDSDPGPKLMDLMHRKSAPGPGLEIHHIH